MFIRKKTIKDTSTGQKYYSYQLVESYRTENGPRQRILLNLGPNLEFDSSEDFKDLANRIEEIILCQNPLFPRSEKIERAAQKYAALLAKRRIDQAMTHMTKSSTHDNFSDLILVDVKSFSNEHCRTLGAEHLCFHMFNKLGLGKKLINLGLNPKQVKIAAATIVARAVRPGSELKTHHWLSDCSALGELIQLDLSKVKLNQLYKISDQLWKNHNALETHLENRSRDLFQLQEKIIIYDITNTYFEGLAKSNPKAKNGRSKEKRSDCPLVAFGLVVDSDGFPKRSETFEGNVAETRTFIQMIQRLDKSFNSKKPIIVMDSGITTAANLQWLRDNNYSYVVVSREKSKPFPLELPFKTIVTQAGEIIKLASQRDKETGEITLYCQSDARKRRETRIKTRYEQNFEQGLQKLSDNLHKERGLKNYQKVVEKIGKLREKYKKTASYYQVNVIKDEKSNKVIKIEWERDETKASKKLTGTYCLQAWGVNTLSDEEIWKTYITATNVEDAFRSMKSELGMRPVYHQKEHRVDGHLFITLLAYHLINALQYELKEKSIHLNWETIRNGMSTHVRITNSMKTGDGSLIAIRNTSKPEPFHTMIYSALDIEWDTLGSHRLNES